MDRREFIGLTALTCVPSVAGCTESTHTTEELDSFGTHNYQLLPAGECLIQPISGSYTAQIEYYVNIKRSTEGYSEDTPINVFVVPEYIVPGEGTRELGQESLSGYLESTSQFDIGEENDGSGMIPPGWNTYIVDNSNGATSIEVDTGGTLYRSKNQVKTQSCNTPSKGEISIPKLDFVKSHVGPPSRLLFHFRIDSPASESYQWTVTALTKTTQTTTSWATESECAAHLAGDWEITDEALNGFSQSVGQLKVEIVARGEEDEYHTERWLDL